MNIPAYSINYAPELTGISKYTALMATTLAARKYSGCVVRAAVGSCVPGGAAYRALRTLRAVAPPGDAIARALAVAGRALYPATSAQLAGPLADRLDRQRTYMNAYPRLPSRLYVQTRRAQGVVLQSAALAADHVKLKCFNTVSTILNKILECSANKGINTHRLLRFHSWGACSIDSIASL
ncbi:hypothetical protein GNZ12_03295 [Paraburkholderia sp. 1N]|uniref:Uncharacterized protein n=1 Tax=Paraburkholderia solitsugae TaxID=2675748 RepID=A0ABX2BHS6_9BURK|nr:hypothetical protein [Paraburkholderia solitsugae]NPT40354.1 hypothetical protein [Paraburkholderia solitsugae]